ncbi:hypothetical protein GGR50DRAFT_301875 [Xylaria sp. CBS 124048]|nr:hypothetical protein GGR50DRAFT_301875 [Xylaria sp. CBS 124048]
MFEIILQLVALQSMSKLSGPMSGFLSTSIPCPFISIVFAYNFLLILISKSRINEHRHAQRECRGQNRLVAREVHSISRQSPGAVLLRLPSSGLYLCNGYVNLDHHPYKKRVSLGYVRRFYIARTPTFCFFKSEVRIRLSLNQGIAKLEGIKLDSYMSAIYMPDPSLSTMVSLYIIPGSLFFISSPLFPPFSIFSHLFQSPFYR